MAKQSGFPKKWIGIGIIVLILLILVSTVWGSYNNLVRLNQGADNAWANVETQYQRRIDLIPNLVNVVESYAQFERELITNVTAIRSQWQTAQTPEQQVNAANQFESAISKLLLISENYPDLKASEQFRALQDNLVETENMVSVARTRYNEAVRQYNTATKVFPSNVVAGWFGFSERTYFQSRPGAENAPVVDLNV
ncbi:MAG: LemA family protein [Candidatus Aenigmarchaeota archaeon]|nr:LemA family protein [Candidatus Aenigmarchaeota archaeon]